ncbi:MAG: alpha-1,2-fucosyltransferase, partial [Rhabdaerophilum sp.]
MPSSRPEVAIQLLGGLGNQMFQAAAGLALAERADARLIFDIARFREKGLRAFALQPFGLEAEIRSQGQGMAGRFLAAIRLKPRHKPDWWRGPFYREPGFRYDPGFAALPASVMIQGYFQSPRYFASIEDRISQHFAPEKFASANAQADAAMLAGEDSVAIHIRRGDYAADPRAAAVHGVLPESYYRDAIRFVQDLVPQARFFIASDDVTTAQDFAATLPGAQVLRGQ